MAAAPFSTSFTPRITRGEVGLSGPNIELIAFNSTEFFNVTGTEYVVGLGVVNVTSGLNDHNLSQMGIVINTLGTLNNFEIGYSADILFHIDEIVLMFRLVIIRSQNNNGIDYAVPLGIVIF